jgi:hypothetical protein
VPKLTILEKKAFTVGRRQVKVQLQYEAGWNKPRQVQVVANAQGVKMRTTTCYEEETGNAARDFAEFDQVKAEKYVAGLLGLLDTKKGSALAEDSK